MFLTWAPREYERKMVQNLPCPEVSLKREREKADRKINSWFRFVQLPRSKTSSFFPTARNVAGFSLKTGRIFHHACLSTISGGLASLMSLTWLCDLLIKSYFIHFSSELGFHILSALQTQSTSCVFSFHKENNWGLIEPDKSAMEGECSDHNVLILCLSTLTNLVNSYLKQMLQI